MAVVLADAKVFSRITLIPRQLLWPAVFVFSMIGAFSYGGSVFDIWVMLISGILGFLMLRHGFSPAPLVMGLILGNMVEESFSQSMIIFDNNWLRFLESPIVLAFFAMTVLSLGWPLVKRTLSVLHRSAKQPAE